jgi:hypothetical protein
MPLLLTEKAKDSLQIGRFIFYNVSNPPPPLPFVMTTILFPFTCIIHQPKGRTQRNLLAVCRQLGVSSTSAPNNSNPFYVIV